MGQRPTRPDRPPKRKVIGEHPAVTDGSTIRVTLPKRLEREAFPREAGSEYSLELVTAENGYQHLELHPNPGDLEGEPAHERALGER